MLATADDKETSTILILENLKHQNDKIIPQISINHTTVYYLGYENLREVKYTMVAQHIK